MSEDITGSYKLLHWQQFRVGIQSFTLPKNAIVTVSRVDTVRNKVLVEFGPRTIDWMPDSILKSFEKLN